jgi:hypothetical protein
MRKKMKRIRKLRKKKMGKKRRIKGRKKISINILNHKFKNKLMRIRVNSILIIFGNSSLSNMILIH